MKTKSSLVLLILLIVALLSAFALIAGAQTANDGMSFDKDTDMTVSGGITVQPNTLSATVYLSPDDLAADDFRPGVVISNFKGTGYAYSFEIHNAGGRPRIYARIGANAVDVTFKTTLRDVMADNNYDEPLTVSIVVGDRSAARGSATLYVYDLDGKLLATETKSSAKTYPYPTDEEYKPEYPQYMIGDCYASSEGTTHYWFKGEIYEVAMYTGYRTETQCKTVLDTADKSMICGYDLTAAAPEYGRDLSGNGHHIVGTVTDGGDDEPAGDGTWLSKNPNAPTDYAYSMVVVPDTQFLTENDVNYGTQYLNSIYEWIVANKNEKNIQLVMGLGDITDDDTAAEWLHAQTQISKLNGVVPYTLTKGGSPHDRNATFNTYFGVDTYYGKNEVSGTFAADATQNAYRLVTAGGVDYLILMLDFGPTDEVLRWAGDVISQHSDRQVIVTTHCYLYNETETVARHQTETDPASPRSTTATGGTLQKNNGDDIWNELVRLYPNIVMVLSGHYSNNNILTLKSTGACGNTVTQMLIDSQDYDKANGCQTGFVAVLYFSEDGKQVSVEYVSTVRDNAGKPAYFKANNQFKVDLFASVEEPAAPDYTDFTTPYGEIPASYDKQTYPFALFVPDATSATGYKFATATKSLLLDTANGVTSASSTALHQTRPDQSNAKAGVSGAVIYMRRDFTYSDAAQYSNMNYCPDVFSLDLGGHTFYDNHTYDSGLLVWFFKAKATTATFTFTIKNGEFVLNSHPLLSFAYNGDNTLDNNVTTVLDKVNISFADGATATSVFGAMFTHNNFVTGKNGNYHNLNINMINCTVDYENAPTGVDLLKDGSSPRSNLYTVGCVFKNRDNVVPKMNITMSDGFIVNLYIPTVTADAQDTLKGIMIGNTVYSVADAPIVEVDGATYRKVSTSLTPDKLGTILSLEVSVDHVYTFSDGTKASKTIGSSMKINVIEYLERLTKDTDRTVAELGKAILAYARAAYDYAEGDESVIERIDGIIGADYTASNPATDMQTKLITDGMESARLKLDGIPAFILYPETDGNGQPIYPLDSYQFALDGQYKLNAKLCEDADGRKYFYISTYAYAMVGAVEYIVLGTDIHGYYNLKAYHDFALGYGDAKLTALVESLWKYAECAKTYREAR